MWQDPIVEEVRQVREAHAAQYNFDLHAIYQALKEQEDQNEREKVVFTARRIPPLKQEMKSAVAA